MEHIKRTQRVEGASVLVYVVEGTVVNAGTTEQPASLMRPALRDAQGQELKTWTFMISDGTMAPGQSVRSATRIENPPAGATEVSLRFARRH